MKKDRPIGIFDSGIGGLTVARAINKILPEEQIIYFGDTAHFPYGDKERSSIQSYSETIARFLLKSNCKAIVIACNTASSASFNTLTKILPPDFPLINVISPVVEHVGKHHSQSKIGVIATKGTINSRIYPNLIHALNEKIKVSSCATPLLAPMIEEGFFNNQISSTIIGAYLSKRNISHIDALILGCTHYPIIQNEITSFYTKSKKKVDIINSAELVAKHLLAVLTKKDLLATRRQNEHLFFVSDWTTSFEKSSEIFFGESIKLKKKALWK